LRRHFSLRRPDRQVSRTLERVTGIEPAPPAWKAGALPLSYTRNSTVIPGRQPFRSMTSGANRCHETLAEPWQSLARQTCRSPVCSEGRRSRRRCYSRPLRRNSLDHRPGCDAASEKISLPAVLADTCTAFVNRFGGGVAGSRRGVPAWAVRPSVRHRYLPAGDSRESAVAALTPYQRTHRRVRRRERRARRARRRRWRRRSRDGGDTGRLSKKPCGQRGRVLSIAP
jgi:hypothetical protein